MYEKLRKLFLLFFLFLLQSCSGGKIGDFLDSSFKNNDLSEITNKDDINNSKKDKKITKENIIQEDIIQEDIIEDKNISAINKKNVKFNLIKKRKNFQPQSYRITVILNEVDPSSPLEEFSNVLRNSNLNFEIENIQRFPKNSNINKKVSKDKSF